jgi:PAS domain S-box-containing protein
MSAVELLQRLLGLGRNASNDPRLNAFFTAAPAGLAILDHKLRYEQLNDTLATMNGVPLTAHLGRTIREVLPALSPTLEPILTRILATGEPALNIEVSGETPAEPGITRYWLASYFPVPGAKGEAGGIGAIVVEDTARRRAEQGRRRSGEQYQAIIENATYGIYRSSADGRFLKMNPALMRMLGYENEADVLALDIGRDVYVKPAQRNELIEQFRHSDRIQGVEVEWKRHDGHTILVRLSGRPVHSEGGELLGFEMIAEDVTEQRALELALRQAQKMETVGQLTGGIAHDFNNLLTIILSHANLLSQALPPGREDLRHDVAEIQGGARRGADLVRKLLGFSRHERLQLRRLDIAAWTLDTVRTLRRLVPENIEIQCETAPDSGIVEADPGALEQVLLNLATNARDAMPDGGTLHLDVRRVQLHEEDRPLHEWITPGPFACATVSDTGLGMDKQTLSRVLEPFFTTKPAGVGTGLGLPMVYGLMKQHRGFIHLYSEPQHGTTVKLYLPLAPDGPVAAPSERQDVLRGGSERILLIEDDRRLREVAQRLLQNVGYQVWTAADGAEGLAVYGARQGQLDLVITDLVMPKIGGVQLYEAIRRKQQHVKMLFTSGYPVPQIRSQLGEDPAIAFVTKPWTAGELLGEVRALLDRSAAAAS